ncbi:arylesterase [Pseudorhodobacter sp.]|uniref:arylesterase n=1 Tax=Pseudorhodobacter sp. TaxID=1934400 RepID=UPI0026493149|nr:arylesterase [Pseudorhodobacter sp.]MDN5787151.1 arylesterase [Pseudorhodobacter sp.]
MKSALRSCLALGYGAAHALRNLVFTLGLVLCTVAGTAHAEVVKVLAYGDSLTAGYGLDSADGFVPQLNQWLADHGAQAEVVNGGVSGDTTAGGVSRLDWSLSAGVDALIINLGGNDMLRGIDPAVTRANLVKMLEVAKAKALPVLLVGLQAPTNYGPDFKAQFDAIFPDLAKRYDAILLPDYFAPVAPTGDRTGLLSQYMQADGIHPNAEGVKRIVAAEGPKVLDLITMVKP